jgi:hypothetical protein
MVAYNYCYSTCLGRIKNFQGKNKFGIYDHLEIPVGTLEKVQDHINGQPFWFRILLELTSALSSVTQWYGLRQANCSQKPFGEDVDRTSRYARNGQRRDEDCKGE